MIFTVILMINMKMKVMTVDLDKSKVKLKLAPAVGTSSVWGFGGHHAGDQGHLGHHAGDQGDLGDRIQRGLGGVVGSCQKFDFDWRTMKIPGRRACPW